ncbi:phospho-sugar mutase [Hugenholtzia roseola]|uniref:phospho-sugar mutase n=1 Tax=Hugenholtzia roseola TaxID=1002 RepID=UPI00040F2552|nr:phospho-sugar mutase [Hugenholtzia roseola]
MQNTLSTDITQKINEWRNLAPALRQAIDALSESEKIDAFYQHLEFGTGGLRGVVGVGTNRMNRYTVGAATQGLANYLKKSFPLQPISVAIAYDNRHSSKDFAQLVADIFSANGIKVFLFSELRPTPLLSFAIRYLGCQSGVVLTASHNPPEYNGYKAYWQDGGQVVEPHDVNIMAEVEAIQRDYGQILFEGKPDLIEILSAGRVENAYLDAMAALFPIETAGEKHPLSIVYSSLHGTGITLVPQILERAGFENVHIVEAQAIPDGDFPTVKSPNPEEGEALTMALEKAQALQADLVLANDPDADRVGIAVRNAAQELVLLNGNQTGALLTYYWLKKSKKLNQLPPNALVIKTIVTSDLIERIATAEGVECLETLTGFKHIAALIRNLEKEKQFVIGGEESYGYLIGDKVRDKDGVMACAAIALMAADLQKEGRSLWDLLLEIYQKQGFFLESLLSITKKGKEGNEAIKKMMADFRKTPPSTLAGAKVVEIRDFQTQKTQRLTASGEKVEQPLIGFPLSDVLQLITETGDKVSMRPSGTEPKIKFYFSAVLPLSKKEDYAKVEADLKARLEGMKKELVG